MGTLLRPPPALQHHHLSNMAMTDEEQWEKEMKEVFDIIDTDGSGNLSLEEVLLYLKSITDDISEENLEKIFEGIDTSGDKVVDFDEFKGVMGQLTEKGWNKLSSQEEVKEVEVRALFNLIDKDNSGELSLEEARKACKLIQARFNISEVEDWMAQVDANNDGKLSYDEFKKSLDEKITVTE